MAEKIVAVVPAFNEEGYISRVLIPLMEAKQSGTIHEVVVVDDGSTDRTGHIAVGLGALLISHHPNRGKSAAFISAANWCRKNGADIMFMTDADMLNLTAEKVKKFLKGICGRKEVSMIRSGCYQERLADPQEYFDSSGWDECIPRLSGFRAVRIDAINPLFKGNKKWLGALDQGGYSLEEALEHLIPAPATRAVEGLDLLSRSAGGSKQLFKVVDDIAAERKFFENRAQEAKRILQARKARKQSQPPARLGVSELESGLSRHQERRRL